MSTSAATLPRLSRIRNGYSVDTKTGVVYSVGGREVGYVTETWMRNHGWIA